MKTLIFALALFFIRATHASEIILNEPIVARLQKNARENPYFLKVGPAKFKIFSFEVGKPTTPFYIEADSVTPRRFYQYGEKCFELSILAKANIARKIRCFHKAAELKLPGYPEYEVVTAEELLRAGFGSFTSFEQRSTFRILGFLHTEEDARRIPSPPLPLPREYFGVALSAKDDVILTKEALSFRQEITVSAEKLGVMSGRSKAATNTITPRPSDLLFANDHGEVLVYSELVPHPFRNVLMTQNPDLANHLAKLDEESKSGPVCYRDGIFTPGSKDCFRMVLDRFSPLRYMAFHLLKIDFYSKTVGPAL